VTAAAPSSTPKVNRVKAGDTCDRSIIAEYDGGQLYRQCPGILRRSRS
jgi:hypothetical protein